MKRWIIRGAWLLTLWAWAQPSPVTAQWTKTPCDSDAQCDDGLFCTGAESCNAGFCASGLEPCPGLACDEALDLCLPAQSPKLEAGRVRVGETPKVVLLANSYERPVVVTGLHYNPSRPPSVARVRQLTPESLEIYLQSPSGEHARRADLSYLVVEEGVWDVGGVRFEARRFNSTVTDREGQMAGEAMTFLETYQEPVVVGQVQSNQNPAWSVFWAGDESTVQAPSWTSLQAGKTIGADPLIAREEEVLGIVVFEAGRGRLGVVEYEAGVTPAAVTGVDDSRRPYFHSFAQRFENPPEVAVASLAGLSDPDVGWALVPPRSFRGTGPIAETFGLGFFVDEDQLGDAERSHGPERAAYVVFERAFSFGHSPMPQATTYTGGSDYYSCRVDQSVLDRACSNALPAVQQAVTTCEQEVDSCASLLNLGGDCASCLSPVPSWKKLPVLAFLSCVPQCGGSLLDFIGCRDSAQSALRSTVDREVCTICGGADCDHRYGIDVNVSGLRCDELVVATVQCESDSAPTLAEVLYLGPTRNFPQWCSYPEPWEVEVTQVLDLESRSFKRACTPSQRSGLPVLNADAQADFDCSCSGAACGDSDTFPLVADVACMPVNSWFRLKTTVTNSCGLDPQEGVVRVDYSSPPVRRFDLGLDARPGDRITSLVIGDSEGATCFNEGDIDSTVPPAVPGGEFSVAQVRCRDDSGAGGCTEVQLSGTVEGEGLAVRPNGVTVRLILNGVPQTKTAFGTPFFFDQPGLTGQSYTVEVVDGVYSFGANNSSKSLCWIQGESSGTVPPGNTFQVADVNCTSQVIELPPRPKQNLPDPDPFEWDWESGLECGYFCDPNPPASSGGFESCDPCTYCRDPSTGTCAEECYCETLNVPGGRCNLDCDLFFTFSPRLRVTAGAPSVYSSQLEADDVLRVSAEASDDDSLQGFMLAVDDQYVDHVVVNGTTGSFSELAVDTSGLAEGEHTLRVIALDDHGSAPTPAFVDLPFRVKHVVDPCESDTAPPSLTVTAPAAGAVLNPGSVLIEATATDAGVGVKLVQFWVDGQYLGGDTTSPYSQPWTAAVGTHTIRVKALDHCNRSRQKEITVTVVDPCSGAPAPTVEITNYQEGQWVDPGLFHFEAEAQEFSGSGIDRVEFKVHSFTNVSVDEAAPYASTGWWLLTEQEEVVTAWVYDGCGRVASDTVSLQVSENASVCSVDQNHPWAGVNPPGEGAVLPAGPVTIGADAADDGVLLAAVLEIDGVLVPDSTILSNNPASYVWTWNATPGPHVIRIKVADVCWKIGWSLPRTVTVQ